MTDEVHELQERAEAGHEDPSLAPVSLTMAVLAVFVAAVSLLGHRAHTEELLLANKSTNQWSYFQAKNIRRHTYELFLDLLSVSATKDPQAAEKVREKYAREVERYQEEQKEIQTEARKLEAEANVERGRADRFDLGEVFLEVALVVTSITLLTKRRAFWAAGVTFGLLGIVIAATGFWVH